MSDEGEIVDCAYCGAALTKERSAEFLRAGAPWLEEDWTDRPPAGKVPIPTCAECQAGIDENSRDLLVERQVDERATPLWPLKVVFFGLAAAIGLSVLQEPVLQFLGWLVK